MIWDGIRTFHDSWGQAPTIIQPLELSLRIALQADSLSVIALGPTGCGELFGNDVLSSREKLFDITILQTQPEGRSLWFGLRGFGIGAAQAVGGSETVLPGETELRQELSQPVQSIDSHHVPGWEAHACSSQSVRCSGKECRNSCQ